LTSISLPTHLSASELLGGFYQRPKLPSLFLVSGSERSKAALSIWIFTTTMSSIAKHRAWGQEYDVRVSIEHWHFQGEHDDSRITVLIWKDDWKPPPTTTTPLQEVLPYFRLQRGHALDQEQAQEYQDLREVCLKIEKLIHRLLDFGLVL
jgi:hypothetical protein